MTGGRRKLIKNLRRAVDDQGRNWEKFFELFNEHSRNHHDPAIAEALEKPLAPEGEEIIANMLRAWNRPWDMWEEEATKRFDLQDRERKRQAGITSSNDVRRQRAGASYHFYREVAAALIARNPMLRRATRHRLAQLVQTELIKQGRTVSSRTIERALRQES